MTGFVCHHVPPSICASCGKTNDAASLGKHSPVPGDISVCLYCGHLQAFADNLTLRDLTADEMRQVAGDSRILKIQKVRGLIEMYQPMSPDAGKAKP